MNGRVGRKRGRPTVYWTPEQANELLALMADFHAKHPARTLHSIAAMAKRLAEANEGEYKGADAD